MPDFCVNFGRRERKIPKKFYKNKLESKRPETYIFRTSSPRPLFWQSLGKSVFSILHDLSWSLQQTALKSFFPYKDRLDRSLRSKVVYKASCWDCDDFYIGKTKRRLHDRKTEHFRALTSNSHSSAIADHMTQTGHKIKWDHFDILATGQSDMHCKIKETLLIRDLKPALNENVGSEKLLLY